MERFWTSVEKTDACWFWNGARTASGYGEVMVNGRMEYAHRVSLELDGRPVPPGMVTDHRCSVRHCVRPDHLVHATQRENILRGGSASAKNARKTHCPRGHPYDRTNTWVNRKGHRYCKACRRERDRRLRAPREPARSA